MRALALALLLCAGCSDTREVEELRQALRETEDALIQSQAIANNLSAFRRELEETRGRASGRAPHEPLALMGVLQGAFPGAAVKIDGGALALQSPSRGPSCLAGLRSVAGAAPWLALERFSLGEQKCEALLRVLSTAAPAQATEERPQPPLPAESLLTLPSLRAQFKTRIERTRMELAMLDKIVNEVWAMKAEKAALEAALVEDRQPGRLGRVAPAVLALLEGKPLLSEAAFEARGRSLTIRGRLAPARTAPDLLAAVAELGKVDSVEVADAVTLRLTVPE